MEPALRDELLSDLEEINTRIAAAISRAGHASSEQLFDEIIKVIRGLQHERATIRAKLELPSD